MNRRSMDQPIIGSCPSNGLLPGGVPTCISLHKIDAIGIAMTPRYDVPPIGSLLDGISIIKTWSPESLLPGKVPTPISLHEVNIIASFSKGICVTRENVSPIWGLLNWYSIISICPTKGFLPNNVPICIGLHEGSIPGTCTQGRGSHYNVATIWCLLDGVSYIQITEGLLPGEVSTPIGLQENSIGTCI